METYQNRSGNSGVSAYAIGDDYILIQFKDGWIYMYSYASTGEEDVENMKDLAVNGQGLNTYISRTVRKRYAARDFEIPVQEYQHWLVREEDHVATLTLNRPQENNSITPQTLRELRSLTRMLARRDEIWAVVLQGAGEHFSVGADTQLFRILVERTKAEFHEVVLEMQLALDELARLPKPVIAKIHGFCLGGGLLLALCCDFRIVSQRTVFGFPEIKLGIAPLWGTRRIVDTVGPAAAKQLVLLGERFNAKNAAALGLVTQVTPPGELDAAVDELAGKFRRLPPRTVGMVKRIIDSSLHLSLRESEDMEIDSQADLADSPDLREAIDSYLSQRPPAFTGK